MKCQIVLIRTIPQIVSCQPLRDEWIELAKAIGVYEPLWVKAAGGEMDGAELWKTVEQGWQQLESGDVQGFGAEFGAGNYWGLLRMLRSLRLVCDEYNDAAVGLVEE